MESSIVNKKEDERESSVGCPNCLVHLNSSARLNDTCELCSRLYGKSNNVTLTTAKKLTVECLNSVSWRCCKRTMIKHQRSSQSLNQCGMSRCASSVVRWSSFNKTFSYLHLIFIIVIFFSFITASYAQLSTSLKKTSNSSRSDVCQSIDIRNSVTQFSRLEGCRVVEGFVQILLIDHADDAAYANLTFPDLVEITGYLLLYRVNGLRSVGRLFPNLTVIRGHSLFINYALVTFEMMHLQEIGLHHLTDIQRGSVRFEKNPALCYVDTIDWDIIAKAGKGEHVISGNKPKNGCPVCEKNCPTRLTKPDDTLCWNRQHCQKICNRKCGDRACNPSGECCDPSCLGGCTGPTNKNCTVCREVALDNQCVKRCPPGRYEFLNRRCIDENECRKMKKPREAYGNVREYPYKPFNNTCVIDCPAGYMDDEKNGKARCKKCDGPCLKECSGASVDSIASAQKLRGCTHIRGSLEIQIRGGKNMVKELEDNLNMIEEIDGYLKIVRSFPLISLNFLRNLKVINGNDLENGKYTLAVLDNQNLQELWDWNSHPPLTIKSKDGPPKVFFHFNPKLCLQKIERLRDVAKLPQFTDLEVAPNSNGDKVACNVTELSVQVTKKTAEAALIQWEAFRHHDPRSLLGYVVYFIEANNQTVTMYDGRDACGGDGWRVDDIAAESTEASHIVSALLTQLKPYTQYAFYVKTYTIATERSGAQSKLQYFTTMPGVPSAPRALLIWSNSSSELVMSWLPPLKKNGNLTHYRIIGRWEQDDPSFLAQRNYCDEPLQTPEKKPIAEMAEDERKRAEAESRAKLPEIASCDCADRESDQSLREKEVSSSIAFEDALHNQVYVKRNNNRRKRDTTSQMLIAATQQRKSNFSYENGKDGGTDKKINGTYSKFERLIPSSNLSFVMQNLRHFAVYNIELQACRESIPNDSNDNCSTKTMRSYRTLPFEHADDIPAGSFKVEKISGNNSHPMIKLQWDEPLQPNGLIVTYQIEYKRIGIQNVQPVLVCIPRRDFVNAGYSYTLKDLASGNYSIKVRATSLAGNGADSEVQYFYIEEYSTRGTVLIIIFTIMALVLLVILATYYVCRRKLMRNVPSMRLIATVNPEYVSTVYVPDEWEVPRKKIRLLRELGNGSFGMVYEGVAKDINKLKPEIRCAVKTVNENATDRERIEFLNEASVMKAFNTHHVVRLLGVVSRGQPTLVIMELMVNGDLKTYLRSHRPDQCENMSRQPPTLKRIIRMAAEIADGMAYLSAKKFVHRDLAARNCMVAEDLTVKIGDFGMTRDIYETDYYRKGTKGLLPVRWMAPESLKDGVFTSYSDVWSYGIVLWEMVTLASQPYQGLSNDQVLRYVIDGGVMERPENCPDSLYLLMRRTWNQKITKRPTFIDIATMLLQEVPLDGFETVSFYHSPEGIEARTQNASHSPQIDKDLEIATLEDLREDEREGDEGSPLREDFEDFANIDPTCFKSSGNLKYDLEFYGEHSKLPINFHDLNFSKTPLKAGFEDFDGVSAGSLSSKGTLDFPFVEENLKSLKNSPSIKNNSVPHVNTSPLSGKNSVSPQNKTNQMFLRNRGPNKSHKNSPDYENRSPEILSNIEANDVGSTRIDCPSLDNVDVIVSVQDTDTQLQTDYLEKGESLNNGYISGTTT
ncbi:insulin-like receptor [Chelonus insularis]|uniref:insulin-like receptor n=1 Tax=Chelonus insularis TaxID=460826 RepID=UPI00158F2ED4|nr:insulin-like receptor [Chelonus insularis]XP_034934207.1 insulin-like receptor [Chelonus insularis]XP_034934217.1 insulin-like receptor [Chelonus insularis]XP_034934227.1 insulin-like receptor [Chelonus insularis]